MKIYYSQVADPGCMTVSQLNDYVKELLEDDPSLAYAEVEGEISNFKHYLSSGHMYFTLKDDDAAIGAVMYKGAASNLSFLPKDGTKVKVKGTVSLYPQTGKYQIVVREMQRSGEGDLYFAYEMLKKKLYSEGLFDEDRKKAIPKFPKKVGIITSKFGAALQDMLSISKRRYPLAEILIYPSLVQGQGAAESMICGLDYFNSTKSKVDVIIIGRGGGSIEDLWAFNDERLARAVYASEIPIISAVGHETDFTICDFVADLRAPTPSAAAELAFPDIREINQQLYDIRCSLSEIIEDKISEAEELISFFSDDKIISLLENKYNRSKEKITELSSALHKNMSNILHSSEQALLLCSELLDANSPHRILSKGYSVVTDSEGNVVHGVDQVKINDKINVRMSDGSIVTEITSINRHITSDNK
jgi:exodeoxyribonuclease VII large subunit